MLEESVGEEDEEDVEEVPGGELLDAHEGGSECVEEDLECSVCDGGGRELVLWERERERERETYAKKTLPRTLLRSASSIPVGRSVSIPSCPRNL